MSFVGLHIHSEYSLLDGASQLPQLIDRAAELGMPAIALTDHGVMYGAIQLISLCQDKGIKPIVGNEMYIVNEPPGSKKRCRKYHQVVLVKNDRGYKNLVKLTTISHLQGVTGSGLFARPCITKDALAQYKEGLIVTSACLGGEVPQAILQKRPDAARKVARWYQEVFGDDYYIEIQDHGSIEDRIVNIELVKIARELGIKIVATNDSHFISCNDVEAHDALLCIQTNKLITEEKRMRYSGTEYLKSAEEMRFLFRDHLPEEVIEEAIANTLEIAAKVEPLNVMGKPRLPQYPVPEGYTADSYIEEVAWQGLLERLQARARGEVDPTYAERLERELRIVREMGFSTYFLVVWDYIKFARDRAIPVGLGRGSAAGSLVAYAMRITNVDPVHHGLLFERFLNPERKSMPDIDTDFCIEGREEVIQYVTEKYGKENVAQIITFNRMTSKAVLKDVARVLGIPYGTADKMAKLIPVSRGKPEKLEVMISESTPAPEFRQAYESDPVVRRWLDMAIRVEGTNKSFGVHAAGVVISSESLDEIVPLQLDKDNATITQYSMEDVEAMGLLKMDFLGLKNLTIVNKAIEYVRENYQIELTPDRINQEELKVQEIFKRNPRGKLQKEVRKTYELLGRGDLEGIFQLESSGMRQVVKDLKPSNVEDISSILALYRPGPLDAGLIPKFINRKHGREPISYQHPLLEPILKDTYGTLCFQEQIMRMAQDLAGYSLGKADLLRRAMGKKKVKEMEKHRDIFIGGAVKNGVEREIAEDLYKQMIDFAKYCFNKSHSMAYAYLTYQTAYLKANFPTEYMAALLTENSGSQDKVQKYISSCAIANIEVEIPDINRSGVHFMPQRLEGAAEETVGKIVFGLNAVRNVGQGAIESILEARASGGPFTNLADLCDRVDLQVVNRRALEALILCGAFDRLQPNRKQSMADLELLIDWAQARARDRASGQGNLLDLLGGSSADDRSDASYKAVPRADATPDYTQQEKLRYEKELLGFYVSDHPLKWAKQVAEKLGVEAIALSELEEYRGKKIHTIAIATEVKPIVTKKGERMAILQLEDLNGKADAVVFPRVYDIVKDDLEAGVPLLVEGKADVRDDRPQAIVEKISPLSAEDMNVPAISPSAHPPVAVEAEKTVADRGVAVARTTAPTTISMPETQILYYTSLHQSTRYLGLLSCAQQQCQGAGPAIVAAFLRRARLEPDGTWSLELDDGTARQEAIAPAEDFNRFNARLPVGRPLVAWGHQNKNGRLTLTEAVPICSDRVLSLILKDRWVGDRNLWQQLKSLLQEYSGDPNAAKIPVTSILRRSRNLQRVRLGWRFWVQDGEAAAARLTSSGFEACVSDWRRDSDF